MKKLAKIAILLIALCGTAAAAEDRSVTIVPEQVVKDRALFDTAASGQRYALLIAINDYLYDDRQMNDLQNAVPDAKALRELLISKYGFPPENVWELYNDKATRGKIVSKLVEIGKMSPDENSSLLIYYSGHGIHDEDLNVGYWAPADAKSDDYSTFINNSELRDYLRAIKMTHLLLVSDSCFSGALLLRRTELLDRSEGDRYFKEITKRPSRKVMASGGLEDVADDSVLRKCKGHSIFACFFLQALRENNEEYITGDEIFSELKVPVSNNSDQTPIYSALSDSGDEGGEFVLIFYGGGTGRPEKPQPEPEIERVKPPQPTCYPTDNTGCNERNVFKVDSCGIPTFMVTPCGEHSVCMVVGGVARCVCDSGYETRNDGACVPPENMRFTKLCVGDVLYWIGDRGTRGEEIARCDGANETCAASGCECEAGYVMKAGRCEKECTANASRVCSGGHVYWKDSCGNKGALYESCPANSTCSNATCLCDSGYEMNGGRCKLVYNGNFPPAERERIDRKLGKENISNILNVKSNTDLNKPISRYEIASLIYNIVPEELKSKYTSKKVFFADVSNDNQYKEEIGFILGFGLVTGYPDRSFRGEQNMSNYEAAMLYARLIDGLQRTYNVEFSIPEGVFTDVPQDIWAANAAKKVGIIMGEHEGCRNCFKGDELHLKKQSISFFSYIYVKLYHD